MAVYAGHQKKVIVYSSSEESDISIPLNDTTDESSDGQKDDDGDFVIVSFAGTRLGVNYIVWDTETDEYHSQQSVNKNRRRRDLKHIDCFCSEELKTVLDKRGKMAQQGSQLDRKTSSCLICKNLLKDPVKILCGHIFCTDCIEAHWDREENEKKSYSCPRCWLCFPFMTRTPPQCYALPFKTSKLVQSDNKHRVISDLDLLLMSGFNSTQRSAMAQLGGRATVSAAAELNRTANTIVGGQLNIQQIIQGLEKDVKVLQQEVEAINGSADKAVEHSEKTFAELIRLIQKTSSDVKQQLRSQQETEVSRVRDLQEKLEQEIAELKRKNRELLMLSPKHNPRRFQRNNHSLTAPSQPTHSSSTNIRPLRYFEDVTAAVSEAREKLQDVLRETWTNISLTETQVDVSLPQPEPKTRADFLRYARGITLDPNTASKHLLLSEGNRKATYMSEEQSYPSHTDRFTDWEQVLSKESLTGRCYLEVEWRGGGLCVAVAYKDISRAGRESLFGKNDKSWMLDCSTNTYKYCYNDVSTPISDPQSSRIGVYLDHSAGVLSFYSVSETKTTTLLRRVQTTFTQPLYAGLLPHWRPGNTAEFSQIT